MKFGPICFGVPKKGGYFGSRICMWCQVDATEGTSSMYSGTGKLC